LVDEILAKLNKQHHGGVNFDAKSGFRINFHGRATCPICGHSLGLVWILEDAWPYAHCDFQLKCPKCLWEGTFGVAVNPLFGMELIIWDTQPLTVLQEALAVDAPICPFHNKKMILTKVWGDKVMEPPEYLRLQWKCPEWFLTAHETVKRKSQPSFNLTGKDKDKVVERLKKLGYID
jgi:hypothetical protein